MAMDWFRSIRFITIVQLAIAITVFIPAVSLAGPVINGIEWRQVTETTGISWNQVSKICNLETGVCNGQIDGVDFTGWTWANIEEITLLFNALIPGDSDDLALGGDTINGLNSPLMAPFFDRFNRTSFGDGDEVIYGWSRSTRNSKPLDPTIINKFSINQIDIITTENTGIPTRGWPGVGFWLYRISKNEDVGTSKFAAVAQTISPSKIIGSNCPRPFVLQGADFSQVKKVAVKQFFNGALVFEKFLAEEQIETNDKSMILTLVTANETADWKVSLFDQSNIDLAEYNFSVEKVEQRNYGAEIGIFNNIVARSNGDCTAHFNGICNDWEKNAYNQCVVYVQRYYDDKGYDQGTTPGMDAGMWRTAQDFWVYIKESEKLEDLESLMRNYNPDRKTFIKYKNTTSTVKPKVEDLIFFNYPGFGHVALVTKVNSDSIEIIQQNIDRNTAYASLPMTIDSTGQVNISSKMIIEYKDDSGNRTQTGCTKSLKVLGWLSRKK